MRHWPHVKRQLAARYPRVPMALWEATEAEYDRIVRLVRDIYTPGRSEITVEAEVRDWLNACVAAAEAADEA